MSSHRVPTSSSASNDLSAAQKRAYNSEAENNFRWLFFCVATRSPRVLTFSDLVDNEVYSTISDIGEYAELAHGSISPTFVFQHLEELCMPGQPLDGYEALRREGARLVSHFRGEVADVQGYIAFRPVTRQLLIAFSGTSSSFQALKDMQVWRTTYPQDAGRSTVHAGFWDMYKGVRSRAKEALRVGVRDHGPEIEGLVLTGHSMGGTMCYFFALDLFAEASHEESTLPRGIPINLVVFGCPRLGNNGLATLWRRNVNEYTANFGKNSFVEYSIKGYNDGVHIIPPCFLGFRHLTESPLYFYHGRLYYIPPSENEHGAFTVDLSTSTAEADSSLVSRSDANSSPTKLKQLGVAWPRGGHNYYNDRDMEKLQRHMRWLNVAVHGQEGWQQRYANQRKTWENRWGTGVEERPDPL